MPPAAHLSLDNPPYRCYIEDMKAGEGFNLFTQQGSDCSSLFGKSREKLMHVQEVEGAEK